MIKELILLALRAITGHRLRSVLSMLGIAIGIASVILLTSIGEGTKRYLIGQFTQFGTNLLAINPGKAETSGLPGALGGSTRHLTIDDSEALERIPGVEEVMPMALGLARSFVTSTRFILDQTLARAMFLRSRYLLERSVACKPEDYSRFRLPMEELFVG